MNETELVILKNIRKHTISNCFICGEIPNIETGVIQSSCYCPTCKNNWIVLHPDKPK